MDHVEVSDKRGRPRFGCVYAEDLTSIEVQALRPLAFRVWVILSTYVGRESGWAVSLIRLADDAGLGGSTHTRKASIRAALDELVRVGLVIRAPGPNPSGTGQGWNRYALRTPPSLVDESYQVGGGESPPGGGGESPPRGGGESPPRGGGESPPPYQINVQIEEHTKSPPAPPTRTGRGSMRHDRRRAARIAGLESTIEEMRNDAKNRLFDEKKAWENQHIDLRHFQDLERFLSDQIEEYRRSAIEEIDREWKQAEEQRAPRRLVHR